MGLFCAGSFKFICSIFFLFKIHICSHGKALPLCSQVSLLGVHVITSPLGKRVNLISLFANGPHLSTFLITHRVGLHSKGHQGMHSSLPPSVAYSANKPYLLNTSLVQNILSGSLEDIKRSRRYQPCSLGI